MAGIKRYRLATFECRGCALCRLMFWLYTALCQFLAQGFVADLERLPDLRSVVGLVQTIAYQEFDFILAYVMALSCFMLLLF